MEKIERLRAMAREALLEYEAAFAAGSEQAYPQWADDVLDVCNQAEGNLQFRHLQAPGGGRVRNRLNG